MHNSDRRNLLKTGAALVSTGALASLGVRAGDMVDQRPREKGLAAFAVPASSEGICGTCVFWGGKRRASEDKAIVYAESLGWCNNPKSHNYQAMTTPETGPMKGWKKWEAL